MGSERIVVIEDEPDILEVIVYNLRREGFTVLTSRNGEEGFRLVLRETPDLVLLDLMLPDRDGVEICRQLRSTKTTSRIPIVVVTAKGEESDVVLGLGVGADDYVTKPFSPRELVARVKAVLRRAEMASGSEVEPRLVVGGVEIDLERHEVKVHGAPIEFTATEIRLLHFLASTPGRVFTRDHLLRSVIGEHVVVTDRNIDVHVRSVRKKLGEHRDLIETVRGVGYRFRDGR